MSSAPAGTPRLRILYAAGPGNIIGSYRHWIEERDDPSEQAITYSSQFFEVCRKLDADAYVVSSYAEKSIYRNGKVVIEHQPPPFRRSHGMFYHLNQTAQGLRLFAFALRFRPDVAVVSSGTTHWFMLSLLRLIGVRVIASLHAALWLRDHKLSRAQRLINWLNSILFFRNRKDGLLVLSEEIARQVRELSGSSDLPLQMFLPTYRRSDFENFPKPARGAEFRILYVGRVEEEKGVFDLLKIARRLRDTGQEGIIVEICGEGSALAPLKEAAKNAGLADVFVCRGHCDKVALRDILARSHLVVVPTRTDFPEGLNKVVVEGSLAGRPVLTSAACPAVHYISTGLILVEPNDLDAYFTEIVRLRDDLSYYRDMAQSDARERQPFYDLACGWGSALEALLTRAK